MACLSSVRYETCFSPDASSSSSSRSIDRRLVRSVPVRDVAEGATWSFCLLSIARSSQRQGPTYAPARLATPRPATPGILSTSIIASRGDWICTLRSVSRRDASPSPATVFHCAVLTLALTYRRAFSEPSLSVAAIASVERATQQKISAVTFKIVLRLPRR